MYKRKGDRKKIQRRRTRMETIVKEQIKKCGVQFLGNGGGGGNMTASDALLVEKLIADSSGNPDDAEYYRRDVGFALLDTCDEFNSHKIFPEIFRDRVQKIPIGDKEGSGSD